MIYWAPLFHFYQPPTQTPDILMKVANESYRPVLEVFDEFPRARATFNINGVLSEMLGLYGYGDVLNEMRKLAERGQIEFTGSGKYHPILPLIPEDEVSRQIMLNQTTNRQYLGEIYQPRGFFPPEMCYSGDIAGPVSAARHEWILVSGIACPAEWPMDVVHRIDYAGQSLAVFFRDDILSNKISFKDVDGRGFIQHLKQLHQGEGDIYVITAMDAETFGHHIQHWDRLFLSQVYETLVPAENDQAVMLEQKSLAEQHRKLFEYEKSQDADEIRIVTISQLLDLFPAGRKISPRPSSWSTSLGDIQAGNYYPLWRDSNNMVHRMQWEHLDLVIKVVHKAAAVADNPASLEYADVARNTLDRALHSCQFWWASRKPMWNINMVDKGLVMQREALLNALKAISLSGCSQQEKKENYYNTIAARSVFDRITDYLFMDQA
jgi:alpha-amylase/alpha-mannosidase (GH57 family)